ncbi:MAG: LamG domain-containing protein [Niabella sp.]
MRYKARVLIFISAILLEGCTAAQHFKNNNPLTKKITGCKGLVAFWDFKDTTGFPVAGTAKQVQLNASGFTRFVSDGPLSGKSMELDGSTSYWYVRHENTGALDISSNAVTVMAWVKWGGGTGFVAGKWNEYNDGGKRQYGLFVSLPYYNGDSQVCGHISKNGGPTTPFPYSIDYSASPQQVPLNTWVCAAFTYDGTYIKSYLNGVFQPREPELIQRTAGFLKAHPGGLTQVKNPYYYPDGMGNNGSDFTIGAVQLKKGMGNFFKGRIGGIAVFNRALSDKEMAQVAVMP